MIRYIRNTVLAALLSLVSIIGASGQEVLSSTFSRDTILIGDQVEW